METEETGLSLRNEDTKNKVRTLYINGKTAREIQGILGIPEGTWDSYLYTNRYGFRDLINEAKAEKFIALTEKVSNTIMSMDTNEMSDKRIAIQQKEAEFLRETLGKDRYSKRIETIGFNLNKSEPLDSEQKEKLDKLFNVKNVEYTEAENK